jgi:nitrite reductase/ring-hydroxylating ferredoxin subunit/uncharacterized membrane protein
MGAETIPRAVGDQDWMDGFATPVQEAIRKLFEAAGKGGQEAKDFLHGKWLGHPLHPAVIDLPLGAWTMAAIFDVLEAAGAGKNGKLADTAIKFGLAGAVVAAIAGATDWSETDGRAKRIGLTHGILNLTATGLYVISLVLRRRRERPAGISVGMAAYGLAMSSAFLGGHLTYGEQIGVDHTATADQDQPKDFTFVLDAADLQANEPKKVTAGDTTIVLVKQGDTIHALRETCTHLGGPLSEGKLEGDSIRCPWHGSRFCLKDGRVLDSPAVYPERTFDVRVRDGRIEVRARNES